MLAIIPARGGSKGLPGKNIRLLKGRPLIQYTIEAALMAKAVSRIVVSTDSPDIARISIHAGGEVPFMRPKELASDQSMALDTYLYTCDKLIKETGKVINDIIVLQPTSPLRKSFDIDNAVKIYYRKKALSVISVTDSPCPLHWHKVIDGQGVLRKFLPDTGADQKNRQETLETYVPNGAVYVFNYPYLRREKSYYSHRTYPYLMPRERSVDIDSEWDFKLAEIIMLKMGSGLVDRKLQD